VNYGPLVFLVAFLGLSASWVSFVLKPQMQVGHLQPSNTVPATAIYPVGRSGLAREGLEVYRANGCAHCHTEQVLQSDTVADVVIFNAGTNQAALVTAVQKLNPKLSEIEIRDLLGKLPGPVLTGIKKEAADDAVKALNATSAKSQVWVRPVGPDIARGWGRRRTIAQDYLYDYPLMLGEQRVGPDLSNVGVRQPDSTWHLRHLYNPRAIVADSAMPPYRFLFERRKITKGPSPDAVAFPGEKMPNDGYEIVPRPEAVALVAYLASLQADAPLFEAPMSVAAAAPASTATNVPPGSTPSTNAPGTNAPTK